MLSTKDAADEPLPAWNLVLPFFGSVQQFVAVEWKVFFGIFNLFHKKSPSY